MAELADALDSGSSGHCARAGSSPVIRSIAEETIEKSVVFFYFPWGAIIYENGLYFFENKI